MEYKLATINELDEIYDLYRIVIKTTKTWDWNDQYPSKEMVRDDIESKNLVSLKDKDNIIAVSFIGDRYNPDPVKNWKLDLQKPARWARICVHPDYQGKGIGRIFTENIINDLKIKGYDGIRIIVAQENIAALKLYNHFNFINQGEYIDNNIKWFCYELKFGEKNEQI